MSLVWPTCEICGNLIHDETWEHKEIDGIIHNSHPLTKFWNGTKYMYQPSCLTKILKKGTHSDNVLINMGKKTL